MIIYQNSAILNRRIKTDTEKKITWVDELRMFTDDSEHVSYTHDELKILDSAGNQVTSEIQSIKKIFDCEIVEYEGKTDE